MVLFTSGGWSVPQSRPRESIFVICVVLVTAVCSLIIHEGGHVAVTICYGGTIESVSMMPGLQLYPEIKPVRWTGYVCRVRHSGIRDLRKSALRKLMGSLSTMVAAYVLLVIVAGVPRRYVLKRYLLIASLVLAWDMIAYCIFPQFGLRHYIFVGGYLDEPIVGAYGVGVPLLGCYGLALVNAAGYHWLWLRIWRRLARHRE